MTKAIAKFTLNGKSYPIEIKWSMAYSIFPKQYNIHLMTLFVEPEETQKTVARILTDDSLAFDLCWFFLEKQVSYDFNKFLELLDEEPDAIEQFREVFYGAMVNFSSPQKKGALKELWESLKREMKEFKIEQDTSSE